MAYFLVCIVFFQSKLYWFESKYNCILLKLLKLASGTTFNNLYNWLQYSCSKLSFLKNPKNNRTVVINDVCPKYLCFALGLKSYNFK